MCKFAVEPVNQLGCVTSDAVTVQILAIEPTANKKNQKQKNENKKRRKKNKNKKMFLFY